MFYKFVCDEDVNALIKSAANSALEIACRRIDVAENVKILYFTELSSGDEWSPNNPNMFYDGIESRMMVKAIDDCVYLCHVQNASVIEKYVLVACWIMKEGCNGTIYQNTNVWKFDRHYQRLQENALSFAEIVLREEGVFS